ncbi:peptidylprolyl isomerase [Sphingomonas sp. Leaf407]|uniref:peptidylprolyl isomerase n=1 Tax=unclassified Sphingomonas TaxID=196159 RepID=UPI0006F8B454|nr:MULTISPECIES: peptidylprolyl isomerase [unclassified Sphingomonas]KQN36859.1 peptidylprolyl isomerase [Sphingomonas sp. Leaf42]KQT30286.1 peptidylprolyl isomerase [Sphingomonas sp. Leaf407]
MTNNIVNATRLGRSIAGILSIAAATALAAQTVSDGQQVPGANLNLPGNPTIFGKVDPNIRKPTAIVNDTVLTGTDVDQRMALIVAINDFKLSAEDREVLRGQVVRQLIDETLQIQQAKSKDITVTAPELEQSFNRLAKQRFQQTPDQLRAYLRSVGSSERSLRRQIEGELAWSRLLRKQVEPFINVGEEEVEAIRARLEASKGTEEYSLREIYISATPDRAAEVQAAMTKIVEQIRQGAPFEYFARNFSEATTRAVGGDLGWVRLNMLPDQLQRAATQMQVGQIAGPIEVPGGYSILYLADKRQVLMADPRDAKVALRQLTLPFPPGTTQAQATQRAASFATATQGIRGCGDATKVAQSEKAEVVDNDSVVIRNLPPALQEIILKLNVGQATPPFGSPKDGIRVLIVCGRDDPRGGTVPSAEQIQDGLQQERVNLRAQRMLRDLRRDAVIEYR